MNLRQELALVAQAQAGDKEALSALWDVITPRLYGYLVNVLRDQTMAEDILQNTWLKAISALANFRSRDVRFSAWLFAIARNECRQQWRTNAREVIGDIDQTSSAHPVSDPESADDTLLIETALKGLSEDEQEIIRLRYLAELSFTEIARVLEISAISARVRVHRALGRARAILSR